MQVEREERRIRFSWCASERASVAMSGSRMLWFPEIEPDWKSLDPVNNTGWSPTCLDECSCLGSLLIQAAFKIPKGAWSFISWWGQLHWASSSLSNKLNWYWRQFLLPTIINRFRLLVPAVRTSRELTCTSAASRKLCARVNWRLYLRHLDASSRLASSAIASRVSKTQLSTALLKLIFRSIYNTWKQPVCQKGSVSFGSTRAARRNGPSRNWMVPSLKEPLNPSQSSSPTIPAILPKV